MLSEDGQLYTPVTGYPYMRIFLYPFCDNDEGLSKENQIISAQSISQIILHMIYTIQISVTALLNTTKPLF